MAIRTDLADKKGVKVIRRARCTPEFLEEIAKTGVPHNLKTRAESSFRVVYGLEAETLFEQFVGWVGSYFRPAYTDPGCFVFFLGVLCSFVVTLAVVNWLHLSVSLHVGVCWAFGWVFMGDSELASGDEKALRDYGRQYLSHPVVFAFSFIHAGRRMVDYYMTWRGKVVSFDSSCPS